jgi:[acyl-carrier-protein] S-malonyltransferase
MGKSLIFPGQGSQRVGMGKDLYENFKVAKDVFENINDSISLNLSKLMFEGSVEELNMTENAQPAIMGVSIAILEVLKKEFDFDLNKINLCAGHSLGEYTALAATSSLDLREVAQILKLRGASMQRAIEPGEGAMAALIGPDIIEAKELIKEVPRDFVCEIANHNLQNQIVLSGDAKAIDIAIRIAKEKNLKAIKLNVSAPFHCKYMIKTAEDLKIKFNELNFKEPLIPIISNYTATEFKDIDQLKSALIHQTFSTVRWYESVCLMLEKGTDTFIEVGYGSTLINMIKRIKSNKKYETFAISNTENIENYSKV